MRGNHECRQMTTFFNFKQECLLKYGAELYEVIMDSFDCLPISCIVNDKFVAIHGGLSPDVKTIQDIQEINRFIEPPKSGAFW